MQIITAVAYITAHSMHEAKRFFSSDGGYSNAKFAFKFIRKQLNRKPWTKLVVQGKERTYNANASRNNTLCSLTGGTWLIEICWDHRS